jgi:hypothetical protein
MCEDFAPNFGDMNWLSHDNATSRTFSQGDFFTKNNTTVVTHPAYSSLSFIEDKTERPPF